MELRNGYTQTEIGVIPQNWTVTSLGSFSELTSSKRIFESDYVPFGIPFFRGKEISQLIDGEKINEPHFISASRFNEIKLQFGAPESGDILITAVGTIANVFVVTNEAPFYFKDGNLIWLRNLIGVDSNYVCAQLRARKKDIINGAIGSSQKALTIVVLRDFSIPLPPIVEQRAIATALSDVDALIAGLEKLIAKKRDFKQAAMQQLLTGQTRLPGFSGEWVVKTLGDIAEIEMGQSPSSNNYNTKGQGVPLIQGNADIRDRKTIRRVFTTQITKRGRYGDFLLSVRAPVGEVARATFEYCIGRGVCAVRTENDFIYHALIYLEPSWARLSKGSTFDSVNSTDVAAVSISMPTDLREQVAIASALADMDAEIAVLESRLVKSRDLKQGMMQELLAGRTRLIEVSEK